MSCMRKPVYQFPTSSVTNLAVQPQKMTRDLKFLIKEGAVLCYLYVAKTKALISFAVTAQLICAFVFAYAIADFLMTQLI